MKDKGIEEYERLAAVAVDMSTDKRRGKEDTLSKIKQAWVKNGGWVEA